MITTYHEKNLHDKKSIFPLMRKMLYDSNLMSIYLTFSTMALNASALFTARYASVLRLISMPAL